MKKYVFAIAMMGLALQGYSQQAAKGKVVYDKVCIACVADYSIGTGWGLARILRDKFSNHLRKGF